MNRIILLTAGVLLSFSGFAQQAFSLGEAVEYGLQNHSNVKNALVDRQDTELDIKQIVQTGLPKINGSFQFTYNAIIPSQLIEAKNFDPTAAEGEVIKVQFGVPWGGQAGISLNQLIFDATWLVGLRAADTYRQLADQATEKTKVDVAENISKAYYSVLVAEERMGILSNNLGRLDTLIENTSEMFKQGFAEQIDLNRLEVQRNNLLAEKQKVENLIALSYKLLKFQMSYPVDEPLSLSEKLQDQEKIALMQVEYNAVNPEDRIEFQQLQTNMRLTDLNAERYQKSALPVFNFTASLGAGHSNPVFNPFQRWFPSSALGIGMNIPIYDSGLRKTQVERQRLTKLKLENSAELLRNSFKLENDQATINLKNGLENLRIQKSNLELAEEVMRVTNIKFEQGVGSNIELVNATSDYREAQTNYFAALYDVLVAKVDLDKAHGKLIHD
ncbi:TolC family protein [Marinilongibacter aquaticus]|uniref:TolC family protein n=1 Tax=Marinilongibacter aquaticus TaxID=2975157 RepID=UPI0021BD672A|nr:TolC family protein [Marinilongibacter aquaticus]UBM57829.1 TolC family protein [Marinilongibacter aquaticus]